MKRFLQSIVLCIAMSVLTVMPFYVQDLYNKHPVSYILELGREHALLSTTECSVCNKIVQGG